MNPQDDKSRFQCQLPLIATIFSINSTGHGLLIINQLNKIMILFRDLPKLPRWLGNPRDVAGFTTLSIGPSIAFWNSGDAEEHKKSIWTCQSSKLRCCPGETLMFMLGDPVPGLEHSVMKRQCQLYYSLLALKEAVRTSS